MDRDLSDLLVARSGGDRIRGCYGGLELEEGRQGKEEAEWYWKSARTQEQEESNRRCDYRSRTAYCSSQPNWREEK